VIFGGHSHTVLEQPLRICDTWIVQGGSHARFVGRYIWVKGFGLVESELIPL
jgi:2',3'-cyclic-nucleotide 2'-phosphodiesterase (5'-nucleotidase family)